MFKLLLRLIFLLLLVFFVVFNSEIKVTVHLFPGIALEHIPLAIVIVVSFALGLLFGVSYTLLQMFRESLNKKIKAWTNEKKVGQDEHQEGS